MSAKTRKTSKKKPEGQSLASAFSTLLAMVGIGALATALYLQQKVADSTQGQERSAHTANAAESKQLEDLKADVDKIYTQVNTMRGQLAGFISRSMSNDPAVMIEPGTPIPAIPGVAQPGSERPSDVAMLRAEVERLNRMIETMLKQREAQDETPAPEGNSGSSSETTPESPDESTAPAGSTDE